MEYQVWIKDEFEGWSKVDCGDKTAALREINQAVRAGKEPLLTVEIPYRLNIKLEEDKIGEAAKSKAKRDKNTRAASEGEVRPGDLEPVSELD